MRRPPTFEAEAITTETADDSFAAAELHYREQVRLRRRRALDLLLVSTFF